MLLKGSLNEPDWLSETHPLSEEVSSLSENKTLENVEPQSSTLSMQPARLVRMLSLLALARPSPLSAQPLILAQRDMLAERTFVSWEAQKSLKDWERKGNEQTSNMGKKEESTKAEEKAFSSHPCHFLSFLHNFHTCIKPLLLLEG